jgi:hypothetical protein
VIANQECCHNANGRDHSDVRALGYIAMQLMQKYAKDDGTIGIDNLNRWSESSEPVKFLLMTNTATSIQELMQVSTIKIGRRQLTRSARIPQASMAQRRAGIATRVGVVLPAGI